jgi:YrbI family 3-deoxy-D-manno-octulosonate 8-phosphate phosphatase
MGNIAFIPVRGGSKSIPLKNIKMFCGKPLVYWTAKAAQDAPEIDQVIIATDDPSIKEVVLGFGFSKLKVYDREASNARDSSSTESVMLEYISSVNLNDEFGFVLIQATSPFLQAVDISSGFEKLNESNSDSLLSCSQIKRFFWSLKGEPLNYDFNNRPRRQDFDGTFVENGAFYISRVGQVKSSQNRLSGEIAIYSMPEFTMTEIDEPDDWVYSEYLMKKYILSTNKSTNIKLVISDVDGVLTDAGMYYTEKGDELKKFNTRDGMGFQLLREAGFKTAVITSENTLLVEKRAQKLKVDFLIQGQKHNGKLQAAREIANKLDLDLSNVAYIGDDINCLELLSNVGVSACPADAVKEVKSIPGIIVLNTEGGDGVFREFAEQILNK